MEALTALVAALMVLGGTALVVVPMVMLFAVVCFVMFTII
jgi:hypothetical protein